MIERWAVPWMLSEGDPRAAEKATRYGGAVTCCGLVGSADLSMNVYPFILRGVSLIGVDSVNCPADIRLHTWKSWPATGNRVSRKKWLQRCRWTS